MKRSLTWSPPAIGRWSASHPYTLVGAVLLVGFALPFCLRKHSDWEEVYLSAATQMQRGEAIYCDGSGYLYPPFPAWAAMPFTALSHLEGRLAWYLINVVSLVIVLRISWHLSGGGWLQGPAALGKKEQVIAWLGLGCAIYYAVDCLTNQKCDLPLAALVLGGCVFLAQGRSLLAATLFGVAAGMRCTPLLWAPYLAWRGRYRAAVWVVCVAVGVNLLPNLTHPPATGDWWAGEWLSRYLLPMSQAQYAPGEWGSEIQNNQSLSGAANRCFLSEWTWSAASGLSSHMRANPLNPMLLKGIVFGGETALLLGVLLILRRPSRESAAANPAPEPMREALEFSIVLLLMLLLSPMSSKTHYCVLFLPAFCLARLVVQRGDRFLGALLAAVIAVGLLSNKDLWGARIYTLALWYGSVTWSAVLLLLGCGYALNRGQCGNQCSALTTDH